MSDEKECFTNTFFFCEQPHAFIDKTSLEQDKTTEQNEFHRLRIQNIIIILIILLSVSGALVSFLIIKKKNHRIKFLAMDVRYFLRQLRNPVPLHIDDKVDPHDPVTELKNNFHLTQREAEILALLAQGLTNHEIALRLFISENTVKYHIKNIYIKLNVSNRVQALQKIIIIDNHS